MDKFRFQIDEQSNEHDFNYIREQLNLYNQQYTNPDNHQTLSIIIHNNDDIIGGLLGGTYWDWLYIDRLWIDSRYRNNGLGKKILEMAESEALKRGCSNAHLDTHDFQGLEFYLKNGYKVVSKLENLPKGFNKYLLHKKLIK